VVELIQEIEKPDVEMANYADMVRYIINAMRRLTGLPPMKEGEEPMILQKSGDPESTFLQLTEQLGIDPDDFREQFQKAKAGQD
jgi:hypothetical protein